MQPKGGHILCFGKFGGSVDPVSTVDVWEIMECLNSQDPRFPLNSVSPGYHSTKPLYTLPELTRTYRNSVDVGGRAVLESWLLSSFEFTSRASLRSKAQMERSPQMSSGCSYFIPIFASQFFKDETVEVLEAARQKVQSSRMHRPVVSLANRLVNSDTAPGCKYAL